jgi:hypothetical protein
MTYLPPDFFSLGLYSDEFVGEGGRWSWLSFVGQIWEMRFIIFLSWVELR